MTIASPGCIGFEILNQEVALDTPSLFFRKDVILKEMERGIA